MNPTWHIKTRGRCGQKRDLAGNDEYLPKQFRLSVAPIAQTANEITETFLTTQRTGAISRMVDLGLLAREKSGLRVTYLTTSQGEGFQSQSK